MNTRPPIESPNPTVVLSVSFNDDSSCFVVGLNTGFCTFDSKSCSRKKGKDFGGGLGLVQMLGRSQFLGLVGGGRQPKFAQNKVIIWNDSKNDTSFEITTLTAVRGVQLGRDRVVVVLQNSVRIYAFSRPPSLLAAYETADNLQGLCCLSTRHVAFPGRTAGHVQLVELATGNVSIIPAHTSALRAMSISPDGDLLATASDTGTLIRVFTTSNCARAAEFRRGMDAATIYSLGFNPSGTMLACTSDKATLHIFDCTNRSGGRAQSPNTAEGVGGGSLGGAAATGAESNAGINRWGILSRIPLMPRVFSDVYSFASAPFEAEDDLLVGSRPVGENITLGTSRPAKGIVGWIGEDSLLVIGAGKNAKWEKFIISHGENGMRQCVREGWKRYMEDR